MTKKTNAANSFQMVMVIWLIISVAYIMYDLWNDGISATYNLGRNSAFSEVVQASQACQPFDVSGSVGVTQLISVPCLQAAQQQAAQQQQGGTQNTGGMNSMNSQMMEGGQ